MYHNVFRPEDSSLTSFGLNWPSVWIKMASSWLCIIIYLITLVLPHCLPGRDFSLIRSPDGKDNTMKKKRSRGNVSVAGAGSRLDMTDGSIAGSLVQINTSV